MISAVLAGLLALGVGGPCFGDLADSKPFSTLSTPREAKAEIGLSRTAENSVVLNHTNNITVGLKIRYFNQIIFCTNYNCSLISAIKIYGRHGWNLCHGLREASWREDNRRVDNGNQAGLVGLAAMNVGVSR